MKPNGRLQESGEAVGSPPRTTLLGTIFSPVFNFFSPANKNGKVCPVGPWVVQKVRRPYSAVWKFLGALVFCGHAKRALTDVQA